MNNLRRIFLTAAIFLPVLVSAESLPWLTFSMSDATEQSVAAENLSIIYKDGNLLLSSASVDQIIPVSQIKSMKFTSSASGVDTLKEIQSSESDYYNFSGIKVGRYKSIQEAGKALPSGVYIVKNGNQTFKVTL